MIITKLKYWWKHNIWEGILGPCGLIFHDNMAVWGMEHGRFMWLPYIFQNIIMWSYNRRCCVRLGHAYEIDMHDGAIWNNDETDLMSYTHILCMSCGKRIPKGHGTLYHNGEARLTALINRRENDHS